MFATINTMMISALGRGRGESNTARRRRRGSIGLGLDRLDARIAPAIIDPTMLAAPMTSAFVGTTTSTNGDAGDATPAWGTDDPAGVEPTSVVDSDVSIAEEGAVWVA